MKRHLSFSCLICLLVLTGAVTAQTPVPPPQPKPTPVPPQKKGLVDTITKVIDGSKGRLSDESRQKAEAAAKAAMQALPDDLKSKALQMAKDPKAADIRQKAVQTVQSAMQSRETPPRPAQETAAATRAADNSPEPPPQVGPQPRKLQPLNLDDPEETQKAKSGRMEITANRSAYFDANTGIAIYRGNVRARHPNASIDCEELEIHMEKDKSGSQGRKKATNDADILASRTEKKAAGVSAAQDTGIEVAYARGSRVTIEKFDEQGELQIGHCNEVAIYDGQTGSVTLRGWPSVQRGNKLLEATDPRCIIMIDPAGRLKADGGLFRTTLIDEKAAQGSQPPANTPAAPDRP